MARLSPVHTLSLVKLAAIGRSLNPGIDDGYHIAVTEPVQFPYDPHHPNSVSSTQARIIMLFWHTDILCAALSDQVNIAIGIDILHCPHEFNEHPGKVRFGRVWKPE